MEIGYTQKAWQLNAEKQRQLSWHPNQQIGKPLVSITAENFNKILKGEAL